MNHKTKIEENIYLFVKCCFFCHIYVHLHV